MWDRVHAVVRDDGSGEVVIAGDSHPVYMTTLAQARTEVMRRIVEHAARLGQAVAVTAQGPEGTSELVVHPDGSVRQSENPPPEPAPAYQEPSYQEPAFQEPAYGEPAYGEPAYQERQGPQPSYPEQPHAAPAPPEHAYPEPGSPGPVFQEQGHRQPAHAEPAFHEPAFPQHGAHHDVPTDPRTVRFPAKSLQAQGEPDFPFPPLPDRESLRPQEPPRPRGEREAQPPREPGFPRRAAAVPAEAPEASGSDADPPGPSPFAPVRGGTPADPAAVAPAPPSPRQPFPVRPDARPRPVAPPDAASPDSALPGMAYPRTAYPDTTYPDTAYPDTAYPDTDRRSFLVEERGEDPARRGVRGAFSRVGMRLPPGAEERAERADEAAVSMHWPGPRTVAVVNGKGGAGKTPGTVLLSAVFAAHGGSGVVAWDNNQTRGTLGWRTQQGPHEATLHDLLPQIDHFLGPTAQLADLAWYVHHQSQMRFDVLRSKPMVLADQQRISSDDVDAIHAVLSKYYRLIFIDSGNDESDPMWLRMIDHTDQLVVATTTRDDHAEAGALLLEALAARDPRSAELARGAVVLVSQADPKATPAEVKQVVRGYQRLAREVVTVPFDPGMVDGRLSLRALRPATQRAWLAAGAAIARGF